MYFTGAASCVWLLLIMGKRNVSTFLTHCLSSFGNTLLSVVFRQVSVIPHCIQRQCHSLALQSGGNVDLSLCLIVRVYLFQKINAKISWIISVPENDFPKPPRFTYPASFICRPIYLSIGLISFKAQLHRQKDLNPLESKVASALPSTCIFFQIGSQTSKTEF